MAANRKRTWTRASLGRRRRYLRRVPGGRGPRSSRRRQGAAPAGEAEPRGGDTSEQYQRRWR